MKPLRWSKEIHAWADGAIIEARFLYGQSVQDWIVCTSPRWDSDAYEFRVASQNAKEEFYCYMYVDKLGEISFKAKYEINGDEMFVMKTKLEQLDE